MEITNPKSLWSEYNAAALPLNVTELSKKNTGGFSVTELYFDGFPNSEGRVRAFIRIYEVPNPKGIILYLPNFGQEGDAIIAQFLACGYCVAQLDYAGKYQNLPRFTIYPYLLNNCNLENAKKIEAKNDALSSKWYVWTCIGRRAALLLREKFPNKKLFAIGRGIGGNIAYRLCYFDDGPEACATLLNIIPDISGEGNKIINYFASLDNAAYAKDLQKPIFMTVCSNDEDGSLDKMAELASKTKSIKGFRIVERAFADGVCVTFNQIKDFFDGYCDNVEQKPINTEISAVNSENRLYFNIKTETDIESLQLYAAFSITNPTYRNWTNIKVENVGDGEYMAHVDVFQNEKPVYAFVNTTDKSGNVFSSELLTIIPKELGITAQQATRHRLIYDGSMGKDVWLSPHGGQTHIETGPFGIDGVAGDRNTLLTFKIGDLLYKAENNVFLQLQLAGIAQEINVSVDDGENEYFCVVKIENGDEWSKFTLSPNDFKGKTGSLDDWSKVIMLKLSSKEKYIVNTILWV